MSMIGARDRLYSVLTGAGYATAVATINADTVDYDGITIAVFAGSRAHATQQTNIHPWLFVVPADSEVAVVEHSGSEVVVHGFRVIVEDRAPDTESAYEQVMAHAAAVRQVVLSSVRNTKYFAVRVPRWDFSGVLEAGAGAFVAQVELRVEIRQSLSTTNVTD